MNAVIQEPRHVRTFSELKSRAYSIDLADLEVELSVDVLGQAVEYLAVPKGELMKILDFKPSSLSTWSNRPARILPKNESDRLARLARVTGIVEQMLESKEDAVEWLNTVVPALGSRKPLSLLGTDGGARMVENTLMRSLAGVYG